MGTLQVAAIDGGNALALQCATSLLGLPEAGGVEGNVQMPLNASVDVPGCLSVADGNDARGVHGESSYCVSGF